MIQKRTASTGWSKKHIAAVAATPSRKESLKVSSFTDFNICCYHQALIFILITRWVTRPLCKGGLHNGAIESTLLQKMLETDCAKCRKNTVTFCAAKKTPKNITAFGWRKNNISLRTAHYSWRKLANSPHWGNYIQHIGLSVSHPSQGRQGKNKQEAVRKREVLANTILVSLLL